MSSENPLTIGDFGLTQERVDFLLSLLKKRFNTAGATKGLNFKVFPPAEFLQNSRTLDEPNIYQRLKDTVWWLQWKDGKFDQLTFMEILVLADMEIKAKIRLGQSLSQARRPAAGGMVPVQIKTGFNPAELAKDEMAKALVRAYTLETTARPTVAAN